MESTLGADCEPHFGRAIFSREANRKPQKLFPFVQMLENRRGVPIHFKSDPPCASEDNCFCHGLLKNLHSPAEDRTGDPWIYSRALYHVAIKAGLYRKAVQVYDIPNQYPVTFSPSMLNLSSNSQEYKNHLR